MRDRSVRRDLLGRDRKRWHAELRRQARAKSGCGLRFPFGSKNPTLCVVSARSAFPMASRRSSRGGPASKGHPAAIRLCPNALVGLRHAAPETNGRSTRPTNRAEVVRGIHLADKSSAIPPHEPTLSDRDRRHSLRRGG